MQADLEPQSGIVIHVIGRTGIWPSMTYSRATMIRVFIDRTGNLKGEALENAVRENAQKAPLNRMAKPEEIANLACFLASDEASYMTGAVIPVDGGTSAV